MLRPEHSGGGIALDEAMYGVSARDAAIDEPYASVATWTRRARDFWNMPFGAGRPVREMAGIAAFFAEGRRVATRS
ncbi:hypothetical protein [Dactylosporangium salmoneum]|uniref:hypothetical protein n=1 Tax=Dactylosporangium salmoneum TaxID=53361 RepID=UPI0031D86269